MPLLLLPGVANNAAGGWLRWCAGGGTLTVEVG